MQIYFFGYYAVLLKIIFMAPQIIAIHNDGANPALVAAAVTRTAATNLIRAGGVAVPPPPPAATVPAPVTTSVEKIFRKRFGYTTRCDFRIKVQMFCTRFRSPHPIHRRKWIQLCLRHRPLAPARRLLQSPCWLATVLSFLAFLPRKLPWWKRKLINQYDSKRWWIRIGKLRFDSIPKHTDHDTLNLDAAFFFET